MRCAGERQGGRARRMRAWELAGRGASPLRGLTRWGTQGEANEADSTPIMTQQHLPDDNARAPIDRSRASRAGGSIGLVLLIAFVLVGAAGALLLIGRAKA